MLLGGLGGTPKDLGIKVSKTLFAPRVGAVYRLNDDTVFRTGYGITYNPLPFSRPLRGFYPLTLAADYFAPNPYGWSTTLDQGIPDVAGPDLSSGKIPLPNEYLMRTSERRRLPQPHPVVERGARAPAAVRHLGRRGLRRHREERRLCRHRRQRVRRPGRRRRSQPFYSTFGRTNSLLLWGPITKSRYHSLQVAINRPFKNGLMLKGAYTLSRAKNETDDDGWDGLMWNAPSQLQPQLRAGRLRSAARSSRWRSSTSCRTRRNGSGKSAARVVLGDWQVNGIFSAFSGTPFTITASGADLNMPGNPQTANLNGEYEVIGKHG